MIGIMLIAALLQQQGPKLLQADESKILPAVIVPVGTVIPITLTSRVNTKYAKNGDGIYGRTAFPISVNNKIVIPEGTPVRGKVTEVKRPGRVKGKAELTLSFQTIVLASGSTIPLYATLSSAGSSGKKTGEATIQGDSTKGEDAGKIATAGAGGALGGAVLNRGDRKKGGAIGGVGGAAIGTAVVLFSRGNDLVLESGTTLEVVLDRPIEP